MMHPVPYGQQLFLQRITAAHVFTEEEAKAVFEEISSTCVRMNGGAPGPGRNLKQCIGQLNAVLVPKLQLEIQTMVVPSKDESGAMRHKHFYGLVNLQSDEPAKMYAAVNRSPHEIALLRLILEKLVLDGDDDDDSTTIGCSGSLPSHQLPNLRTSLEDPHKNKLTINAAERAINKFIEDKWLEIHNNKVKIGPRCYMELGDLLTDLGVKQLPQMLINRTG